MIKLVVLSCMLAMVAGAVIAPWGYAAPFGFAAPLVASNYRGPWSLAPGQPANILAADGRPLDTLDVNVDRSAHFTAKALTGVHLLKKRAAVWPVAVPAPVVAHAPYAYAAHLAAARLAYAHAPLVHW